MKTVPNAKRIALRSYSMWANYAGIAALVAPEVIYAIWQIDTNPRIWWISGLALILIGIVGRMIDQGMTRSPGFVMILALFVAMAQAPERSQTGADLETDYTTREFISVAVPRIRKWEGAHRCNDDPSMHCAYLDTIAEPDVWTACHGETKGITRGMRFTDAECADMLADRVLEFRAGWRSYVSETALSDYLHVFREAAFVDLAYNVGVRGAGRSTATRRLNNGDIAGSCTAIGWWNRAGQRVVRGLVNRRTEFVGLCRLGIA